MARSERAVVPLVKERHTDQCVGAYLNRLSDFLFVCARFVALKQNKTEVLYKKPK